VERERVREREAAPAGSLYDRIVARQQAAQAETQGWEHVARSRDRRWEPSPWGRIKWLTHPRLHTAMRTMCHYLTELPPGGRSAPVRHLWEAVGFVLQGRGYSVIDGVRYDWEAEDALCLAPGVVYQHFNTDPAAPARFIWGGMLPLAQLLGLGGVEELPDDAPPAPAPAPAPAGAGRWGNSLFGALQEDAAAEVARRRAGRVHISGRATPWEISRQGRLKYYTGDPVLGTATRLIRMFLQDLPPGARSGRHRHFNEAALYCLEGRGYSIVDGEHLDWEAGDLNIVHIDSTHQHFNADPERPARLLAIHSGSVGGIFDFLGQLTVEQQEDSTVWQQHQRGS
jgi:quercetin dioxygenase-like cupin family protein